MKKKIDFLTSHLSYNPLIGSATKNEFSSRDSFNEKSSPNYVKILVSR